MAFRNNDAGCDWAAHEAEGFSWWRARVRHALCWVDAVRLTGLPAGQQDRRAEDSPPYPDSLVAALVAALRADYGVTLPVIAGDFSQELLPGQALCEVLPRLPGCAKERPETWRFTWDSLTPEIAARLALNSAAEGVADKNANDQNFSLILSDFLFNIL